MCMNQSLSTCIDILFHFFFSFTLEPFGDLFAQRIRKLTRVRGGGVARSSWSKK